MYGCSAWLVVRRCGSCRNLLATLLPICCGELPAGQFRNSFCAKAHGMVAENVNSTMAQRRVIIAVIMINAFADCGGEVEYQPAWLVRTAGACVPATVRASRVILMPCLGRRVKLGTGITG